MRLKESGADGLELTFDYELEPFGAKVLYLPAGVTDAHQGQWLPSQSAPIDRPDDLPKSVKIADVWSKTDPLPDQWKSLKPGQHLWDVGIDDGRFVYYRTTATLREQDLAKMSNPILRFDAPADDHVVPMLNGEILTPIVGSANNSFSARAAKAGQNEIVLLYENTGSANGGRDMEKLAGMTQVTFFDEDRRQQLKTWKMHVVERTGHPEKLAEIAENIHDEDWPQVNTVELQTFQLQPNETGVFRTTVKLSEADLNGGRPLISIGRMDDEGWVFVNGQFVGDGHSWNTNYEFNAAKQWHVGQNTIAIVVQQ